MSPVAKKSREDKSEEPTIASVDPSSGFIHLEVDVNDIPPSGIYSPVIEVLGMPWKLKARKIGTYLAAFLYSRKSDCDMWSVNVAAVLTLVNFDGEKNVSRKFENRRSHENDNWGFDDICKWEELIDEEKGFVKNGKITIEARFTLSNVVGIRTIPRIDFTDATEPRHDVALLINGEKVYVSKQILAVHSPIFHAMFYGKFAESGQKEVKLKDIDLKVFIMMLNLIYPSYQTITEANAEPLLRLADRYQVKVVLDQVEQFFIDSKKMSLTSKLALSDRYRLVKLQEHCLDSLKTVKDITDLKEVDGYKELSKNIKGTLMEKVMRLA